MKTLILLRGVPGSGKTTFAELLVRMAHPHLDVVASAADDHMVNDAGDYEWDPNKLDHAHLMCQTDVTNAFRAGADVVIVHNTSCRETDVTFWQTLATEHGYEFVSLVVENRHGGQNVHGADEKVIRRNVDRLVGSIKLT